MPCDYFHEVQKQAKLNNIDRSHRSSSFRVGRHMGEPSGFDANVFYLEQRYGYRHGHIVKDHWAVYLSVRKHFKVCMLVLKKIIKGGANKNANLEKWSESTQNNKDSSSYHRHCVKHLLYSVSHNPHSSSGKSAVYLIDEKTGYVLWLRTLTPIGPGLGPDWLSPTPVLLPLTTKETSM